MHLGPGPEAGAWTAMVSPRKTPSLMLNSKPVIEVVPGGIGKLKVGGPASETLFSFMAMTSPFWSSAQTSLMKSTSSRLSTRGRWMYVSLPMVIVATPSTATAYGVCWAFLSPGHGSVRPNITEWKRLRSLTVPWQSPTITSSQVLREGQIVAPASVGRQGSTATVLPLKRPCRLQNAYGVIEVTPAGIGNVSAGSDSRGESCL
mmetsp:Transcript_3559/g.11205  ORF Transcript_3559/g.11205 Transcript_3559/m.11205 type:complete len:204 (+) Transcript_3559:1179-1790(+)